MIDGQKVALVTGAAQGIGRAIAGRLAADGYAVAIADMADTTDAVAAVAGAGHRSLGVTMDVADEGSIAAAISQVRRELGPICALVNNAGLHATRPQSLPDLDYAEWRRLMAVNLDGMFLVTRAALPDMVARKWGRIVNIASASANALTPPGMAHYIASKAGAIGFTRGLATDVGVHNITANAISPTAVVTPGLRELGGSEELLGILTQMQAIKRVVDMADVAGVASFLASEDSAMVTAQTIIVDGGGLRVG